MIIKLDLRIISKYSNQQFKLENTKTPLHFQ